MPLTFKNRICSCCQNCHPYCQCTAIFYSLFDFCTLNLNETELILIYVSFVINSPQTSNPSNVQKKQEQNNTQTCNSINLHHRLQDIQAYPSLSYQHTSTFTMQWTNMFTVAKKCNETSLKTRFCQKRMKCPTQVQRTWFNYLLEEEALVTVQCECVPLVLKIRECLTPPPPLQFWHSTLVCTVVRTSTCSLYF